MRDKRDREKKRFIDALTSHGTVYHAAQAAGVSRRTAYRWRVDGLQFAFLISCIVLLVLLGLVQSASTQATKRSFESNIPPHVPLKIKIKEEKEEKALDINNKNWFRDMEIEVTNTSEKPIYFLSLNIELVDLAPDRPNALRVFFLSYGRGEFVEQNTKPIPEDVPIEPNATHTFVINENQRNGFEKWRTENNGRDALKLRIWMNHLSYGDGTGFTSLGALPFPFKNNPR